MSDYFAERKWGKWMVLAMQPGYKVKKLTVEPGQALSRQYHTHRDEYWVVLQGRGKLVLEFTNIDANDPLDIDLGVGSFIKIHKQVIHKLANIGDEPLIIIETQVGDICEEGDIIRLD